VAGPPAAAAELDPLPASGDDAAAGVEQLDRVPPRAESGRPDDGISP
jgi:hypothetical protein